MTDHTPITDCGEMVLGAPRSKAADERLRATMAQIKEAEVVCPHDAYREAEECSACMTDHTPDRCEHCGAEMVPMGGKMWCGTGCRESGAYAYRHTADPPLTDEELAEMERRYPAIAYQPIPRLIADLRASRAEVERLNKVLANYRAFAGKKSVG